MNPNDPTTEPEGRTAKGEPLLGPAAIYRHDHPPIRSINAELESHMTFGQHVADRVASVVGSWPFILIQSAVLLAWLAINVWLAVQIHTRPGFLKAWDPYPFILLNLLLSFQAAYTGPVVMMSQNRQSLKDRLAAESDYEVNQKAEQEIQVIMEHLAHQDRLLLDAIARVEALALPPAAEELSRKVDELLKRMEANDRRILSLMARMNVAESG